MTLSHTNPIYFPSLMSNFDNQTNEQASGEAIRADNELSYQHTFEQVWCASDTIRMQLFVDFGESAPTIRIDWMNEGQENSATINGVPVFITGTSIVIYHQFEIPVAPYAGSFSLTIIQDSTEIDTSVKNRIIPEDCKQYYRTRRIEFAYLGCSDSLIQHGGTVDSPAFLPMIRIGGALSFEGRESEVLTSQNTDRTWEFASSQSYVVETLESEVMPDYMHRLLSWIFLHRHIKIDGTRYIFHADWQPDARPESGFIRRGNGQLKLYETKQ